MATIPSKKHECVNFQLHMCNFSLVSMIVLFGWRCISREPECNECNEIIIRFSCVLRSISHRYWVHTKKTNSVITNYNKEIHEAQ